MKFNIMDILSGLFNVLIFILAAFPIGLLIAIIMIVFGIFVAMFIFQAVQSYIMSIMGIVVNLYTSPIVFVMRLFDGGKPLFDIWKKDLQGNIINSCLPFAIVAIFITLIDFILLGDPTKYNTYNLFNASGTINSDCYAGHESIAPLACLMVKLTSKMVWWKLLLSLLTPIMPFLPFVGVDSFTSGENWILMGYMLWKAILALIMLMILGPLMTQIENTITQLVGGTSLNMGQTFSAGMKGVGKQVADSAKKIGSKIADSFKKQDSSDQKKQDFEKRQGAFNKETDDNMGKILDGDSKVVQRDRDAARERQQAEKRQQKEEKERYDKMSLGDKMKYNVNKKIDGVKNKVRNGVNNIKNKVRNGVNNIKKQATAAKEFARKVVRGEALKNSVNKDIGRFKKGVNDIKKGINDMGKSIGEFINGKKSTSNNPVESNKGNKPDSGVSPSLVNRDQGAVQNNINEVPQPPQSEPNNSDVGNNNAPDSKKGGDNNE